MENTSLANLDHLLQCKAALPGVPPQLRLSLASTISRIREVNKVEQREQTETCGYCFTDIDVAKDKLELVKRSKAETNMLKITCRLCKKVCRSEVIEKIPERKTEMSLKTKPTGFHMEANENHSNKKKKRSKDHNAGLVLPVSKKNALLGPSKTSPKTSLASKAKLKILMSYSDMPQRSGLQDFLKKL